MTTAETELKELQEEMTRQHERKLRWAKKYRDNNKEKVAGYSQTYALKNRKRLSDYAREYYAANKERINSIRRERAAKKNDKLKALTEEVKQVKATEHDKLIEFMNSLKFKKMIKYAIYDNANKDVEFLNAIYEAADRLGLGHYEEKSGDQERSAFIFPMEKYKVVIYEKE